MLSSVMSTLKNDDTKISNNCKENQKEENWL